MNLGKYTVFSHIRKGFGVRKPLFFKQCFSWEFSDLRQGAGQILQARQLTL
jgi:hypothetical protein